MRKPVLIAVFVALTATAIVLMRARTAQAPAPHDTHEAAGTAAPAPAPAASTLPPKLPPNVTAAPLSDPAQAAAEPPMRRTQRNLMGTVWMIGISGGDEAKAKAASEHALDE